MKELLFLAHRIPYPPNKGDKIRSFNLLKHLSLKYRVHLGSFVDAEEDWAHAHRLDKYCASHFLAPLQPAMARLRGLTGFFTGEALTLPYYRNSDMQQWVDRLMNEVPIEVVVVFSSAMAQYVNGYTRPGLQKIIDFVDVDSDKWRQYSERQSWPWSAVYRREARQLAKAERIYAGEFDRSILVSDAEAALFRSAVSPECARLVSNVNNGVDIDYFSPDVALDSPYPRDTSVLAFTGAMDYWANVDAVTWFSKDVLPQIRNTLPHAQFYVVGARPTAEVLSLAEIDGVTVTGGVDDIRPYIRHATLSVAPLRIARGIQNKVLEAMALAVPVLSTESAADGIEDYPTRDLLVVDCADSFARRAIELLQGEHPADLGERGREFIVGNYSWGKSLQKLDEILENRDLQPTAA